MRKSDFAIWMLVLLAFVAAGTSMINARAPTRLRKFGDYRIELSATCLSAFAQTKSRRRRQSADRIALTDAPRLDHTHLSQPEAFQRPASAEQRRVRRPGIEGTMERAWGRSRPYRETRRKGWWL